MNGLQWDYASKVQKHAESENLTTRNHIEIKDATEVEKTPNGAESSGEMETDVDAKRVKSREDNDAIEGIE